MDYTRHVIVICLVTISFGQSPVPQQNEFNITLEVKLLNADANSSVVLRFDAENLADNEIVTLYNQYGDRINKKGNSLISFLYWPPPLIYIHIVTNSKSNATINWHAYPYSMVVDAVVVTNITDQEPNIIGWTNLNIRTKYVYRSATHVVLSTVNYPDVNQVVPWMNLFLYDGEGADAPLIGTVYNTINSKNFVSTGHSLTIYCVNINYNPSHLIVNDLSNLAQFSEIKTVWSYTDNSKEQILLMDASKGPAVLTVGDYEHNYQMLVTDISFTDPAGSMIMYNGVPSANPQPHMLATYSVANVSSQLAQQIFPDMTTFVLNKGQASLNLSISSSETNWNTARVGRSGFLCSPHYEVLSENQNINNIYFSPESSNSHYKFTFHLLRSVSDPFANYSIVADNGTTVYNGPLNSNAESISVLGQSVNLTVYAGDSNNRGVLVRFEMSKHSSSVNAFLTVACLLILVDKWLP